MDKTGEEMRKMRMKEELYQINQKSETKDIIRFDICGTTFPDKNYVIRRPMSKLWCIEYVEAGSGTIYIGDEVVTPKAGDSYFLHGGKNHYYFSDSKDPWKKHFINLSGKLVESLAEGYGVSNIVHFPGLNLESELKAIIEIVKKGEMDNTPELIVILNGMFLKMHASIKKDDGNFGIGTKMKDFLNAQITSEFRIELLCKHISKSESQTIRIFKSIYGITPYAYVLQKKIDFAQKLLADTSLSVKEIATKLHFFDEYYFSNIFKKKVGISPLQYRVLKAGCNSI